MVRSSSGRWIFLSIQDSSILVEYQPLVVRKGLQIVLLDLGNCPIDSYVMTDAYPNPDPVELGRVERDDREDAVMVIEWAARHLVAGVIGTDLLLETLDDTTCRPLHGGLYENDGLLGTVQISPDGEVGFQVSGELVWLTDDESRGMLPIQRSGVTFLEKLE